MFKLAVLNAFSYVTTPTEWSMWFDLLSEYNYLTKVTGTFQPQFHLKF